jgi:hypothetical protein
MELFGPPVRVSESLESFDDLRFWGYGFYDPVEAIIPQEASMSRHVAGWMLSIGVFGSVVGGFGMATEARELDQDTYRMLSHGMTEADVVSRAGQPDRRLDQLEATQLNQRLVSYQYVWGGDTNNGEWTTTVTFSANTNRVIRIERDRK